MKHMKVLVGGILAIFFLNILNSAYSNVLALIKEELMLSYASSGALMSSYFIGYTIGQIPWGFFADRAGSRRAMTLSVIGIALSTVMFGLTSNIWNAILFRFFAGLLGAGIFVPGVRLVSSWFSPSERGTALGLFSLGGSVGLMVASWTAPIMAIQIGWRSSIIIYGFIGILSSIIVWLTLQDRRGDRSQINVKKDIFVVLRSRSFWILSFTQFIRLGSYFTFISWLPLLLHEEYGLSLISASFALSMFNFAGMLSNPAGGFISDRVGEKRVLIISFIALALDLILFMYSKFPVKYVSVIILGGLVNFIRSPSFTLIPKLYSIDVAGQISGIHNTFASLGALTIPLFIGYIRDITLSYNTGWIALSVLLMLGAFTNLFLKKPRE